MKREMMRVGLFVILPLLLTALALLSINEADAFESESDIVQTSDPIVELVSGEEPVPPIIGIIGVEQ